MIKLECVSRPDDETNYTFQDPRFIMEFRECDSCMSLPGSPYLCKGCLHNREVIGKLKKEVI